MKIFVNDVVINLLKEEDPSQPGILLRISNPADVIITYEQIRDARVSRILQYNFLPSHYEETKEHLLQYFDVVEASGGIVVKDTRWLLFIKRLGKWDLPKGKIDKGEKKKTAAIREVEEECGVKARIVRKVGVTWHTYLFNKVNTIKKTTWYEMECIDDSAMSPQHAEDITKVKWFSIAQPEKPLANTYVSIKYIYELFLQEQNLK
jgi:8-oxo-dGTP pyrophosphatase MutT (NUDIX family)